MLRTASNGILALCAKRAEVGLSAGSQAGTAGPPWSALSCVRAGDLLSIERGLYQCRVVTSSRHTSGGERHMHLDATCSEGSAKSCEARPLSACMERSMSRLRGLPSCSGFGVVPCACVAGFGCIQLHCGRLYSVMRSFEHARRAQCCCAAAINFIRCK